MAYEAGNVVVLKSGGQPMTVVAVSETDIECVWLGEEGELFRQSIPAVALEVLPPEDDEDESEDSEEEGGHEEEAEQDRAA